LRQKLLTPKRIERLQTKYKTLQPHDEIERSVLVSGKPVFTRRGDRFRGVVPFNATKVCQECHAVPVDYTLGAADLHISLERISQAAVGNWKRSTLIFLAFVALAIAVASVIFTRFVSKPIDRLVAATTEVSRGNLDSKIPDLSPDYQSVVGTTRSRSSDELAFLALKFDEMRTSLKEKIDQLDRVNKNLSERNREVEDALGRLRQAQEDLMRSERLAVTGKMTAQLSHEINNPIHNIQSLLESSLRKINGESQARELIGVALEEVTRMAKLTRQMLEFYRGSMVEVEKEVVDIKGLLVELVKANEEPLAKQNINIVLEIPHRLPSVCGSRDKLKQVFLNLIINARDAMPQGGTIMLMARGSHGIVRVVVKDTGTGIPHEDVGRIFDAFFTTKKEVSGVGLGLSVSYGIVQQHKGVIHVTSTIGEGSVFTVELPVTRDDDG
jgi:two-component system NtrC family sensor kinase